MVLAAIGGMLTTVLASAAPAGAAEGDAWTAGDRYYQVVFDRTIPAHQETGWRAACPDSHPYLDAGAGVQGWNIGQGVEMVRSSWKIDAWYTGHQIWPEGAASAIWGTARNWLVGDDAIRLTMVCTRVHANVWWP